MEHYTDRDRAVDERAARECLGEAAGAAVNVWGREEWVRAAAAAYDAAETDWLAPMVGAVRPVDEGRVELLASAAD